MKISRRGTIQPRAAVLDINFAPPPEPAVSFGDIDPDFDRRRRNLERTRRDATVVEAEAMGTAMLDDLARDEARDPTEIRSRGEAALDALMSDQLASVRDRALETGMRFKLDRVRNRLSAQLVEIEASARNMAIARSVMQSAQRVFDAAGDAPERVGLMEPLDDVIEASDLPADHKEMLKTRLAARAVKLGFDGHLGPRFAKFTEPGRQLLVDTERAERAERQAAPPDVVLARTGAPTADALSELLSPGQADTPLAVQAQPAQSSLEDVFPEGLPRTVRQGLRRLEDGERTEFESAVDRLRGLDAPDDVVRRVVEDVARGINARQQSVVAAVPVAIVLGVTALVALSLETQRRQRSAEGAGEAATGLFDRLVEDMRGLLQDEGGDDEDENRKGRADEAGSRGTAEPDPEDDGDEGQDEDADGDPTIDVDGSMLGSRGTQIRSNTLLDHGKKVGRIDLENPNPGQRAGQIHYQIGNQKYIYNVHSNRWVNKAGETPPKRQMRFLDSTEAQRALSKGLRFLRGE